MNLKFSVGSKQFSVNITLEDKIQNLIGTLKVYLVWIAFQAAAIKPGSTK